MSDFYQRNPRHRPDAELLTRVGQALEQEAAPSVQRAKLRIIWACLGRLIAGEQALARTICLNLAARYKDTDPAVAQLTKDAVAILNGKEVAAIGKQELIEYFDSKTEGSCAQRLLSSSTAESEPPPEVQETEVQAQSGDTPAKGE